MEEKTEKDIGAMTFEEAMAELTELVRESETGKLPLDRMLSNLERGNKLAVFCRSKLNELERRIEILTGGESTPEWDTFDPGRSNREI